MPGKRLENAANVTSGEVFEPGNQAQPGKPLRWPSRRCRQEGLSLRNDEERFAA
jgi:hypothetical protein